MSTAERFEEPNDDIEAQDLKEEVERTTNEAQMVLPGVMTLFGFQVFAALNETVRKELGVGPKALLAAALCVAALSAMAILIPPAWRRQVQPGVVSHHFIELSSKAMRFAMLTLAFTFAADVYVVFELLFSIPWIGAIAAVVVAAGFLIGWFAYPFRARRSLAGIQARALRNGSA